ncbi:hypothetical protein BHE74_00030757 [Ensete ventricosum]|nr:hypothetical protein BHE74_00030757 [Ensete ventricosum]
MCKTPTIYIRSPVPSALRHCAPILPSAEAISSSLVVVVEVINQRDIIES